MFLNIQIDLLILKTYYGQFTLTTKKSLHIIFNTFTHETVQKSNKYMPLHSFNLEEAITQKSVKTHVNNRK